MNEQSQVSGCYNITFNYTNQETVSFVCLLVSKKKLRRIFRYPFRPRVVTFVLLAY